MRKIIVQELVTINSVMQAPDGPEENPSAKFEYGGWQAPFMDDEAESLFTYWNRIKHELIGMYEITLRINHTSPQIWVS